MKVKIAWIVGAAVFAAAAVPLVLKLARDPKARQRLGLLNSTMEVDLDAGGAGIEWVVDSQQVTILHREGQYEKALERARKTLELARAKVGEQHPDTATSYHNVGSACYSLGQYAEAEEALLNALAIREKTLKPTHRDLASTLENLAVLYRKTERPEKASPLEERAAIIRRNKSFSFGG